MLYGSGVFDLKVFKITQTEAYRLYRVLDRLVGISENTIAENKTTLGNESGATR